MQNYEKKSNPQKKNPNFKLQIPNYMKINVKNLALSVIATVLLASCSCNWHIKRVQNRCPDYLQTDTAVVVRPAVQYDTVFFSARTLGLRQAPPPSSTPFS